jgi:hypothetical protein
MAPERVRGSRNSRMIEASLTVHPGKRSPRIGCRRMDQLLERGILTAPKETETPMIPANRRVRIIIQRSHLLKVQRDIKTAFSNQQKDICYPL